MNAFIEYRGIPTCTFCLNEPLPMAFKLVKPSGMQYNIRLCAKCLTEYRNDGAIENEPIERVHNFPALLSKQYETVI